MTKIWRVNHPQSPNADVVFIHGLMGDLRETWTSDNGFCWPKQLAFDFPTVRVWSVGYDASLSNWTKRSMDVEDYASSIADLLFLNGVGDAGPIYFVCHSLGGLIAKEILRQTSSRASDPQTRLLEQTRGVMFLATPHRGTPLASFRWVLTHLGLRPSTILLDLIHQNKGLAACHQWFRDHVKGRDVKVLAYREILRTKGAVTVPRHSADPELQGVNCVPLHTDHSQICKPNDRDHQVYLALNNMLTHSAGMTSGEALAPPILQVSDEPSLNSITHLLDTRCAQDCRRSRTASDTDCALLTCFARDSSTYAKWQEDDLRILDRSLDWIRQRCSDRSISWLLGSFGLSFVLIAMMLQGAGQTLSLASAFAIPAIGAVLIRRRKVVRDLIIQDAKAVRKDLANGRPAQWSLDVLTWIHARGIWRWLS